MLIEGTIGIRLAAGPLSRLNRKVKLNKHHRVDGLGLSFLTCRADKVAQTLGMTWQTGTAASASLLGDLRPSWILTANNDDSKVNDSKVNNLYRR